MSKFNFTAEQLRELLHYAPATGVFTWRVTRSRTKAGSTAGHIDKDGRRVIGVMGREYFAAPLAWLYVTGTRPAADVDHKDRNRQNDAWENLRVLSRARNLQNSIQPQGQSGLRGACFDPSRRLQWKAIIRANGKTFHLGRFATAPEAHQAYMAAKKIHHPDFHATEA